MGELRMRDLCARTGLSRQAIHFYVEQGLVAPPQKTGRTMGYYTEAHVERILLVRKLQEEHFLPLKAIRSMLDDGGGEGDDASGFTRAQQTVLSDVKARLSPTTIDDGSDPTTNSVEVAALLRRTGVTRRDLARLEEIGLVTIAKTGAGAGKKSVAPEDAWLIELWGQVREAGFTRELGFEPDLLLLFEQGIDRIFEEEKKILARMAALLPAERVAAMVDRALPLVHTFIVRAHQRKVRQLFASLSLSRSAS